MICTKFVLISLISQFPFGRGDELAIGFVDEYGKLDNRGLTAYETARGADNFFLDDPMDSHDFAHVSTLRKSLLAQMKATSTSSNKVASFEEALKPIFVAMPKDRNGRLESGTARYALHRLFSERNGWSIKGLQPAGASWRVSMTVDEDVKDISKYMIPSYLQDVVLKELGLSGFDLHSLAILAATLEHLIHAETINLVYAVYKTLELPIASKLKEQQVNDILDAFMTVYVFGVNLDVSDFDDLTSAKLHLNTTHPGWPQIQAFAQETKRSLFATSELDFDEIVQVVEQIGDRYVAWQGRDCSRVRDKLASKPSYSKGAVKLSEASSFVVNGSRELLTEDQTDLRKIGALRESSTDDVQLIIPNYINSQSMCLSTASFYTSCCINECEGLLAKLERGLRAPAVKPEELKLSMKNLPQKNIQEAMLQELDGLKDAGTGLVSLHSRAFAQWMHHAFPLQCPAPDATHGQKVTNPKTPDEWIAENPDSVAEFQDLTKQLAKSLRRYTTMGAKNTDRRISDDTEDPISDANIDIMRVRPKLKKQEQKGLVPSAVGLAAVASMGFLSMAVVKSGLGGLRGWQLKGKKGGQDMDWKDFA